jgi:hypothetical protein
LEHVRDVVEAPNLGLEGLVVDALVVSDLASGLLKRDYWLPPDEEVDKLLTKVAQRLYFLILRLPFSLLAH